MFRLLWFWRFSETYTNVVTIARDALLLLLGLLRVVNMTTGFSALPQIRCCYLLALLSSLLPL